MTDLRKAAEMALEVLEADEAYIMCAGGNGDHQRKAAEALKKALAQEQEPIDWELDVNEVREVIYENVPDPDPELLDKLYGLVSSVELMLQEKNT